MSGARHAGGPGGPHGRGGAGASAVLVRRRQMVAAVVVVVLVVAAFVTWRLTRSDNGSPSGASAALGPTSRPSTAARSAAPTATASPSTPSTTTTAAPGAPVTIHLAFAGDVHFAGTSAAALTRGLGSGAEPLAKADLAVVNLETAITNGGVAAAKEFNFRAPPKALQVIKAAGVDAVSIANNHGMDYGATGLSDALAASKTYGLPIIGAGENTDQAFHGLLRTVNGVRVAVISATDVLDSSLQTAWTATDDHPGLASAKGDDLLVNRIKAVSAQSDVVVAFLHWGVETEVCPTARQQQLAAELVAAGADIVVGSHAHVLQPLGHVDGAPVAYGMGNFVFYGTSASAVRSGVLRVTVKAVPDSGSAGHPVLTTQWLPATIESGRPVATALTARTDLPPLSAC